MNSVVAKLRLLYRALMRGGQNRIVILSAAPPSPAVDPIFLIGCLRSGTSLLRRIVDSHSCIACPPESHFLVPLLALLRHRYALVGLESMGFSSEAVRVRVRAFADQFFASYAQAHNKPRWADKTPMYVDYLDAIDELYQGRVRYLMIYRHGLDVAYSMTHTLGGFLKEAPNYSRVQDQRDPSRIAAAYWREQVSKMQAFQAAHPERCFELRYEQLVQEPRRLLAAMCGFLGEEFEEGLLRFNDVVHDEGMEDGKVAASRGFEPSIGNYRRWTPSELRAALNEAGTLLAELGYSV